MKKLVNMTDCYFDTDRYRDGQDTADFLKTCGFDGIEFMHCAGGKEEFFLPETIGGMHIRYFNEWVDLWKGNMEALRREYDTLEQAEEVFGGLDRECLFRRFSEDLDRAAKWKMPYVVFHISDVKISELLTYTFSHTDEEVIDAAAELVNQLLDGKGYSFEFLMENLWWPGLTMTRPDMTRRLLDKVHYPKKGIMLDTGHLMHTNPDLETQEEAVDYILEMVKAHGELASCIRGIHLNQSITGKYVKEMLKEKDKVPKTYRERLDLCYRHLFQIDSHLPFTTGEVCRLIEEIKPEYLTVELITRNRAEHEEKLKLQAEILQRYFT